MPICQTLFSGPLEFRQCCLSAVRKMIIWNLRERIKLRAKKEMRRTTQLIYILNKARNLKVQKMTEQTNKQTESLEAENRRVRSKENGEMDKREVKLS